MAAENAKRDGNFITVGLVKDTDGNTKQLRVDATTGALLIDVKGIAETGITDPGSVAQRDGNFVPVSMASDGTNPQPLVIDNRNGYLRVDIL